jgi:glutathione S-transferase
VNLTRTFALKDYPDQVWADVARIEALWADCRARFGAGGDFLFGRFSAADAMYTPVVTRLQHYQIPVKPETRAYMDAILNHPAFLAWKSEAHGEPWYLPHYEEGHVAVAVHVHPQPSDPQPPHAKPAA